MWQKIIKANEINYLKWNTFTWVGILLIIICGVNATYGLERHMDVLFWDESLYLSRGLAMFKTIPKSWGPSYSLWYKCLSYLFSDKIVLYYFNFKLTTILLSICFFLLLMSCGVQRVLSFIFSLFFLSSFINMPVWPRVSHYCIIILLTGIIIAKYQKTIVSKFVVYSVALLIGAYARPELFLPFVLFFALTYFFFFINLKNTSKLDLLLLLILSAFFVFMYVFFRTPLNNGDSSRGIGVFLQHFAMNYAQWHHSNSIFWLDFKDIIDQNFPHATSLKEIILSNPKAFEHHIISNATNYFIQTGKIIFSFFAPIFTKHTHWLCLMVSIMLFMVYFSFTKTIKYKRKRFLLQLKNNWLTIFVLIIFTMPPVFVCFYAYPRAHYLVLQTPLLLLITGFAISSISVEISKPIQKIIVVAVVWFFVMPVAEDFSYFNMFRNEENLCNLKSIQFIKKNITTKDTVHVFDMEGGMTNLLPPNFVNINYIYLRDREKISMSRFLLDNQFDIIYKTPTLTLLKSAKNDDTLIDILKYPNKYGYIERKTGNFAATLLIKQK